MCKARASSILGPTCLGLLLLIPSVNGQEFDDPIPIRRVLLPNSKSSEILKDKAATFELLSRIDFEALVRKAAEARAMTRSAPRLVHASYVAEFKDAALINGTGSWEIANPGGA